MYKLLAQIIAGTLGIWLATQYIPGVEFTGNLKQLFLAGLFFGLINFFVKPVLKLITLPLRIITFGLFGLILNILVVWSVSALFSELTINGIKALALTTIIIWISGMVINLFKPRRQKDEKDKK